MPRHRENPLIIPFRMLCPGISQNTKQHHLTLYKGQVWQEKPYLELCNHNVLNIVYDSHTNYHSDLWPIEMNGTLHVPPVPSERGFIRAATQIAWDSEILQSFAKLTNITNIIFRSYHSNGYSVDDVTYQILVGSYQCMAFDAKHHLQCAPPNRYYPKYIWTKEGLKMQRKISLFSYIIFTFSIF